MYDMIQCNNIKCKLKDKCKRYQDFVNTKQGERIYYDNNKVKNCTKFKK
jgi:hypothetical protein